MDKRAEPMVRSSAMDKTAEPLVTGFCFVTEMRNEGKYFLLWNREQRFSYGKKKLK